MAPFSSIADTQFQQQQPSTPTNVSSQIRSQWSNPSDILSLLLLVGGDVVQRALAQQTGGHGLLPPPVVFSFGWVAYTFLGLLTAVGDKTFLPGPELSSVVLGTEWGYHRINNSWIIARMLRDYEELWMPLEVRNRLRAMLETEGIGRKKAGLCVSVFQASDKAKAGVPKRDFLWYSGYLVAALQLGIAVVPWASSGIWEPLAITALGTTLAFLTASLPHWTRERWPCRKDSKKTFILTRGNGSQHAVAVIGAGRSLDFEDLATSSSEGVSSSKVTSVTYAILTILWCALLITVDGIQEQTWALVAIGAVGMVHTVIVAGAPRRPEVYGVHLDYQQAFVYPKCMKTLQATETRFPGIGRSMLSVFFPGELHPEEEEWWKEAREKELLIKKKNVATKSEPKDVICSTSSTLSPGTTPDRSTSPSISTATDSA